VERKAEATDDAKVPSRLSILKFHCSPHHTHPQRMARVALRPEMKAQAEAVFTQIDADAVRK